jgi:hypothetical protein
MIEEAGVDRTGDEVGPFVEVEAERYRAIREHLAPAFTDGHPEVTLDDLREHNVIVVNREDEAAYELVWDVLEVENPKLRRRSDPFGTDYAQVVLTRRAGAEACRQVGELADR